MIGAAIVGGRIVMELEDDRTPDGDIVETIGGTTVVILSSTSAHRLFDVMASDASRQYVST